MPLALTVSVAEAVPSRRIPLVPVLPIVNFWPLSPLIYLPTFIRSLKLVLDELRSIAPPNVDIPETFKLSNSV